MNPTKPKALLSTALHRTSSDLMDLLYYFDEEITVLIPYIFFDEAATRALETDRIKFKALKSEREDRDETLREYEARIRDLDLSTTEVAEHEKLIKELLEKSLPVSIELIDAMEEAKEQYQIIGFFTTNEAFPRERIMRDWSIKEGIPTLHVNHGLILSTPGGAYWEFATDVMTTACPNEVDFLEEAFGWQKKPPRLEITGMPSWDKYALVQTEANRAAFFARHGLQPEQKVISFFPTIRNTTYLQLEKKPDPHITGIEAFITAVAEIAGQHPDAVFIIKDRPGNEKFMQDFVAIQREKKGLSEAQLRYEFDYAEPYVAFSDITIATKSTISGESVICRVPHINLIDAFGQALAFDPEINMAHVHTSELADFLDDLLHHPEKREALREAQQESDALTGPARDFCSSLRVARVMAELIGEPAIARKIDADLAAWQTYLQQHPGFSIPDLLEDGQNPLRFHWRNVERLLNFDHRFAQEAVYNQWLKRKTMQEVDGQLMGERMQRWQYQPSFHLVFVADASLFNALADSLSALDDQMYKHFGISIISRDACPDESLLTLPHLQWIVAEQPFEQLNSVIDAVESDWILLPYPGDILVPDALFNLADYANLNRDWMLLYGDEDRAYLDHTGELRRKDPFFKPDFNLELLRATNYLGQCVALRRDAVQALGGLTSLPYVQAEDFALRLAERMTIPAIGHLPMILNHRSAVLDSALKLDVVQQAAQQVRLDHLARCGYEQAQVQPGLKPATWQISYPLNTMPRVALLLPLIEWHASAAACVESILTHTDYPNWRLYIAAPQALQEAFDQASLQDKPVEFVTVEPGSSRVAAYTQLANQAQDAEFLCLMETDVHCVQSSWLTRLVMHGQRPEVGMVAPRLVRPNGRVFSAGQILGMNGDVGDLYQDFHLEQDLNTLPRAWCDQNFSALNASCVLLKREYLQRFGLNDTFPNAFYLTDLGLRMQMKGLRLHWTPYATLACHGLIQHGKNSIKLKERPAFYEQWFDLLLHDPAHNPNLQLRDSGHLPDYRMAVPWHPVFRQQLRVFLAPLHVTSDADALIGSLSYLLELMQKDEQLRLGVGHVNRQAKDEELPHLIELARLDADLVIFCGEEVGNRIGQAALLKHFTHSKVAIGFANKAALAHWSNTDGVVDLFLGPDAELPNSTFVPLIDKHWAPERNKAVTDALHEAFTKVVKKV